MCTPFLKFVSYQSEKLKPQWCISEQSVQGIIDYLCHFRYFNLPFLYICYCTCTYQILNKEYCNCILGIAFCTMAILTMSTHLSWSCNHTALFTLSTQDVKVQSAKAFADSCRLFSFVTLWRCWGRCARRSSRREWRQTSWGGGWPCQHPV